MDKLQLDAWGIIVGEEIDNAIQKRDQIDLNEHPCKYGYYDGVADGLAQAMTWLNIVESNSMFRGRIAQATQEAQKLQ